MITCKFENGGDALLRHVTVDVLAHKGNEVLMVKRLESLAEGGKWALPGGYFNRDETLGEAALRELHEETGWRGKLGSLLVISSSPKRHGDPRNWQNVNFTYIVALTEKDGDSDWESTAVKFFPLDMLPPRESIAFDHDKFLDLYVEHLSVPKQLPIML